MTQITNWRELVRKNLIPNIPDFKRDYPEYIDKKDWWNIPPYEFIIFHPIAARSILPGTFTITLAALLYFFVRFMSNWIAVICLGIIIVRICMLAYKYRGMLKKDATIYKIFLQEDD